jgi:Chlamydia polymorphic membrane protein (Chlamydia_PMP) repeat
MGTVLSVTGGSVSFVNSTFSGTCTRPAAAPCEPRQLAQHSATLCSAGNWASNAVVLASETDVVIESCTFTSNAGRDPNVVTTWAGPVIVTDGSLTVSNSRQAHSCLHLLKRIGTCWLLLGTHRQACLIRWPSRRPSPKPIDTVCPITFGMQNLRFGPHQTAAHSTLVPILVSVFASRFYNNSAVVRGGAICHTNTIQEHSLTVNSSTFERNWAGSLSAQSFSLSRLL